MMPKALKIVLWSLFVIYVGLNLSKVKRTAVWISDAAAVIAAPAEADE